jgi:hypothetical protein
MKKQKSRARKTNGGVIIGIISLGALLFLVTLALPLIQPQSLRTSGPTDSTSGSFGICQYDDSDESGCARMGYSECALDANCSWEGSYLTGRCIHKFEHYCKYEWPQFGYAKHCFITAGETLPRIYEAQDCQGPGSDQYTEYHYVWSGHGHPLDEYIDKANSVISNVFLENSQNHAINRVTILDRGCCTFDRIPQRQFDALANKILKTVYERWWQFKNRNFPANFRVWLIANQMTAWRSLKPRFTLELRRGLGIADYYPIDCEEIGGTHEINGGDGEETICSHHAPDDCERQQLVNPGGDDYAYFRSLGRSTCDGTIDLEP